MTGPKDDLGKPENVVFELFDSDEDIKKQFELKFSAHIIRFAEAFAAAYARFPGFTQDCQHNVQTSLVGAFVHGVLDDLVVSMKLILTGKLGASGNAVRQGLEGMCMAAMCAQLGTLSIGEKEQIYWELVRDDDQAARGDLAARQFVKNWSRLGLNDAGAKQLKEALELHNPHSHAGRLAMANRMDLGPGGKIYFGGHYDEAKAQAYSLEFEQRINICRWLVELMDELWARVKNLQVTTPPAQPPTTS